MSACDDFGLAVLAQQLLDCAVAGLAECDRPVCQDFLATSTSVAWDECCECAGGGVGMLWVSLVAISPVLGDPEQVAPCGWEYDATFQVAVLRCDKTVIRGDGTVPPPEVFTQQAKDQMQDARIIRSAIVCCFGEDRDPGDYVLGAWAPLGPDGGCVGGVQNVTIRFTDCACS